MLISALCFSLMQLCVKFLSHLPFTELVFFRSIVSLVLSLIILKRAGVHPLGNKRKYLVLRGIFGVIALSSFFFTLQNLPIATAIVIQYLSPMFTALFAIWILKEPMKPIQWLFFALSFAGIIVIKGFNDDIDLIYMIAGVVSAVFAGLAYNMIGKVKGSDHPVVVVFYFPLIATPIMGVVSLFYWETPVGWDWLIILAMGIFTQLAQVTMTKAWQAEEANQIAPLKYVGIIFALFWDYSIFGISHNWSMFVGIGLVISGVVANLLMKKRLNRNTA
ncbi:DMT family transporter [Salibacter halophilus]|uniref:DMT family transporter n=2 Tax=Salibacter halophilus TaxID=1803916 RepID=A0A6N6M3Y6_9FLAO|nr:DMT family transporter [Salibacter halophilus]